MTDVAQSELNTDMAGLPALAGTKLRPTEWAQITQDEVNQFADITNDHNFIHVDPERAKATPFGGTVVHGFLSLAMLAPVGQQIHVSDATMVVNYGMDKVRFPGPLPVSGRWRGSGEITDVTEIKGGLQVHLSAQIEVEGAERPAVVAECLIRFYA
jgi:acyl dehydratase